MPNEPEREIEKSLKAYAKQRQADAGAPRELHPATRRLLQGEIARVHKAARDNASARSRLFPRWTVALSVMAMVLVAGVAIFLMNGTRTKRENLQLASAPASMPPADRDDLAGKEGKSPPQPAPVMEPAPARRPRDTLDAENSPAHRSLYAKSDQFKADHAKTAIPPLSQPTGSAAAASGSRAIRQSTVSASGAFALNKKIEVTNSLAKVDVIDAPPPPPAVAVPAPVAAENKKIATLSAGESGALKSPAPAGLAGQKFYRITQTTFDNGLVKDSPNLPVLASFKVGTTGDQIRIVDSDGSVYDGRWSPTNNESSLLVGDISATPTLKLQDESVSRNRSVAAKPAAPASSSVVTTSASAPPTVNYFFRVTGTNLSLKQPVVFTGKFAGNIPAVPVASPAPPATFGAIGGAYKLADGRAAPPGLSNLRITGRAVIGTNQMDISAKADDGH